MTGKDYGRHLPSCPDCGGTPQIDAGSNGLTGRVRVKCRHCGLSSLVFNYQLKGKQENPNDPWTRINALQPSYEWARGQAEQSWKKLVLGKESGHGTV